MRSLWVLVPVLGVGLLAGCAPSAEDVAAKEAERAATLWEAGGHAGLPPVHDAAAVRSAIEAAVTRAQKVIANGSTDADCDGFGKSFDVLSLAEFDDGRDDYMAPLSNALSQITSGCEGRGTWEGTLDDVADVVDLGNSYLSTY